MDTSLLPKDYQIKTTRDIIEGKYLELVGEEYRDGKDAIEICKDILALTNQLLRLNGHKKEDVYGKEYAAALAVFFESKINKDLSFPALDDNKRISHAASLLKAFERRYGKDGGFARNREEIKGMVLEQLGYGTHIGKEPYKRLQEIGIDGEVVESAKGLLHELDKELEEGECYMDYFSARYGAIDSIPDARANIGNHRRELCEAIERRNKNRISIILRDEFGIEREPEGIKFTPTCHCDD